MGRQRNRRRAAASPSVAVAPRAADTPAAIATPAVRRLAAAILCAVVLAIYVRTLAPTVAGGDSGELITVAYTMGVAHPPGYPLYTLLANLFTRLPIGTIAWRVNLFSAVGGAGAAMLLLLAVARWTGNIWAAAAAASLFAFSPRVWPHAVTAEVFALNNFFLAALLYLTVRFAQTRDVRVASVLFLCIGLGLSNHHTLILYAVPAALFVLVDGGPDMRRPRRLALFAACGVTGLLPYAYLPIASRGAPLMSWGDETTVSGFVAHVLRQEYGTFRLGIKEQGPSGVLVPRVIAYVSAAFRDLLWTGPVLAIVGVIMALRQRPRALAWCWIAAFLCFIVVFNTLANTPLEGGISRFIEGRFWQQPHLLLCAFAGVGLARVQPALGWGGRFFVPAMAVVLAIAQPAIHFRQQDKSGDTHVRAFLKGILDSMPSHALLLETGDQTFNGLRYMQLVEGYRTDIRVLDQMLLGYPWHERLSRRHFSDVTFPGTRLWPRVERSRDYGMKAFVDANRERFAIFFVDIAIWDDLRPAYTPWPSGLADRILRKPEEPTLGQWMDAARASFATIDADALRQYSPDSWEWVALRYYWQQMGKHALSLARWGQLHDSNRAALTRAAELIEDIFARSPDPPHQLHRDLGVVYQQLSTYDPSAKARMQREFESYLTRAAPGDPDVEVIRHILEQSR